MQNNAKQTNRQKVYRALKAFVCSALVAFVPIKCTTMFTNIAVLMIKFFAFTYFVMAILQLLLYLMEVIAEKEVFSDVIINEKSLVELLTPRFNSGDGYNSAKSPFYLTTAEKAKAREYHRYITSLNKSNKK